MFKILLFLLVATTANAGATPIVGYVHCTYAVDDLSTCRADYPSCFGDRIGERKFLKATIYACLPDQDATGCEGASDTGFYLTKKIEQRNGHKIEITISGQDNEAILTMNYPEVGSEALSMASYSTEQLGPSSVELYFVNGQSKVRDNLKCMITNAN